MKLIGATQAAKIYGCSRANIYYLVREGCLKPVIESPLLLKEQDVRRLSAYNDQRGGKRGPCA